MSDPLAYIEIPRPVIVQGGGVAGTGTKPEIAVWDANGALVGFTDFTWNDNTQVFSLGPGPATISFSGSDLLLNSGASITIKGNGNTGLIVSSGGRVQIQGAGNDLLIADPSGNGSILLGSQLSLGSASNTGFPYIFGANGTPSGSPSLAATNNAALYVDTGANAFYFFSSGTWHGLNGASPAGAMGDVQINNGAGGFGAVSGTSTTISNQVLTSAVIQNGVVQSLSGTTGANSTVSNSPITNIVTTFGIVTSVSAVTPVADGTYTLGLGLTQNGTITTVSGVITAIQQVI